MKTKVFTLAALLCCASAMYAQESGYKFTTVASQKATPVKNQASTGTCWCFATTSFMESELLRIGKGEYDLSEMFIVRQKYLNQLEDNYYRGGNGNLGQGSLSHTWKNAFNQVGIVPEEVYHGINYNSEKHNHGEMVRYINALGNTAVKMKRRSAEYYKLINNLFDTYLGELPEKFTYKGKEYTPKTFGESLGINPDDYVSLTSYTHHPFYTQFAIEIQDNWRNGLSWNLPIDELMAVMDNAIKNGYTFAWGSDVSEQGFTRDGIAVMPDAARGAELTGSDMARWTGLTAADKRKELTGKPLPEVNVTQEMRQTAFDNWETTDDHGMVIYGIAKDQNGKEYFMVKNSWGLSGKYKGIWYASKAFVAYKTMNILVHKDALPKDIAKKLGIK